MKKIKNDAKLEKKIRKMLGSRFHLNVICKEDGGIKHFHLYRKYEDPEVYFSPFNEEIMSDDTNSIEDLYNFARNHIRIDVERGIRLALLIGFVIVFIISLVNIYFKVDVLSIIVITSYFNFMLIHFALMIIENRNYKTDLLEAKEYFEKISKTKK